MLHIRGAREHNLRDVSLSLPTHALTVFCGVSGSGKSSLAFDTVHAEGRRRYLEALSVDRSGQLSVPPAVDAVEGLPPTIALAQRAAPPSRRSTVGSLLDVEVVLRTLFARAGTQHCPICGDPIVPLTHDEIVARVLALPNGSRVTLEAPLATVDGGVIEEVERAGFSRLRLDEEVVRLDELKPSRLNTAEEVRIVVDRIKVSADRRDRIADSVRLATQAGQGVMFVRSPENDWLFVDRPFCYRDQLRLPNLEPALLSAHRAPGACPTCHGVGLLEDEQTVCPQCEGTRLSDVARAVRWRGSSFPELLAASARELSNRLASLDGPTEVEQLTAVGVVNRLACLERLSLAHLSLAHRADHLSSSEFQRLRLARQVAGDLSGVLYILDEPAAGLDADLVGAVVELLRQLVDNGNTVIAVEHHTEVVRAADHVVEFGPGAGKAGGRILYQGDVDGLLQADTTTGRWMSGREMLDRREASPGAEVRLHGRWRRGQPSPELRLARGCVHALCGPSASGKSTALAELAALLRSETAPADGAVRLEGVEGLHRVAIVERSGPRTARSSPATYVGLWDVVRELFAATREARIRGFQSSTFSLNTKGGRCSACRGTGQQKIPMGPLPDLLQPCPVCEGRRFELDVLQVRWKGLNPSEILAMEAKEAQIALAGHPDLDRLLRALVRVGLGYVPLGQSASSLSGGEAMRLALARELARAEKRGAEGVVFLLDDPTVGLHPADVKHLLALLRALTDDGATVWLATSDPSLAAAADLQTAIVDSSSAWEI